MSTDTPITTADELFKLPSDGFRYELVRGELRKKPLEGAEHAEISSLIGGLLMLHVRKHRLGSAYDSTAGFKIASNPDTILLPDVAFVAQERIQKIRDKQRFIPFAPDLAIEIISLNDLYSETVETIDELLSAGTQAVVLVDPRRKKVTIYRSPTRLAVLTVSDVLEVPNIVLGWSLAVSAIFGSV